MDSPENGSATESKSNITEILTTVPAEVIDFFGKQQIIELELSAKTAEILSDIAHSNDPFDENSPSGLKNSMLSTEARAAITDAFDAYELDIADKAPKSISQNMRQVAPILAASATEQHRLIHLNYQTTENALNEINDQIKSIDITNPRQDLVDLAELFNKLMDAADGLIGPTIIADYRRLRSAQIVASNADAASVAFRKKQSIQQRLIDIKVEIDKALKVGPSSAHKKMKEYDFWLAEAEVIGMKISVRHRLAHPAMPSLRGFLEETDKFKDNFTKLRNYGSSLHNLLSTLAGQTSRTYIADFYQYIINCSTQIDQYSSTKEYWSMLEHDHQVDPRALAAEAYVADKTELLVNLSRQTNLKFADKSRRTVHELRDRRLERTQRNIGRAAVQPKNETYENIVVDTELRRLCHEARDFLVGGQRIKHKSIDISSIARKLHILKLGRNQDIILNPSESGMVIAVIVGRLNVLADVTKRFEAASQTPDPQILKLKHDLPEQYQIIQSFNLDQALSKLMAIVNDSKESLTLYQAIQDSPLSIDQLKNILNNLWLKRQNGDAQIIGSSAEAEPELIFDEEALSKSEQMDYEFLEPTEANPQIINQEFSDIADQLEWEVFPHGTTIVDIQRTLEQQAASLARVNWDRIRHLLFLAENYNGKIYRSRDPQLGTRVPYLVVDIELYDQHRIAVAECPEIGNATYIVDNSLAAGTWEEVMRLSKADARSLGARRVIHPKEEGHLNKIVRQINSMLLVNSN